MKKYIPTTMPNHFIKLTFDYHKGDNSYYGNEVKRGYYGNVRLVEHEIMRGVTIEQFMLLNNGCKMLLLEVARKSPKAEKEALAIFNEKSHLLIDEICQKQNLQLTTEKTGVSI